jgi:hypothetical protein
MSHLDPADYESAMARGEAVRIPAMRASIYVEPADWAPRVFAATRVRSREALRYYRISDDEYETAKKAVLRAAREPTAARDLRDALGGTGRAVLSVMCREGVLMRATASSLRSNTLTYVAADAWLDGGLPAMDAGEALAWLAREYLRAFGPGRIEDFAWWSGEKPAAASKAIASCDTVELDGGQLLLTEDRAAFERSRRKASGVSLLPKWDAYTMGYAPDGRARLVEPELQSRIYEESGDCLPVILVDGLAAGVWRHRFAGKRMEVEVELFDRPTAAVSRAVRDRIEEAGELLGAGSLSVHGV